MSEYNYVLHNPKNQPQDAASPEKKRPRSKRAVVRLSAAAAAVILAVCIIVIAASFEDTESTVGAETVPCTIELLGANMVYVNEGFFYTCKESGDVGHTPNIEWECVGGSGRINNRGWFIATEKGEVTITVKDTANNLTAKLLVHVVESAADVDFVPMVNNTPVVNKTYPLPSDYDPGGLTAETDAAFKELVDGAAADGIEIFLISGYRSYTQQQSAYLGWCNIYGQKDADSFSAHPGFSEHQLGMAIDVNSLEESFAYTAEGRWLAEHCPEYGFIIRYPQGCEQLTGYVYEPWHIRYVGKELAKKITDSGMCLEEYFGIDSVYR